MDGKINQVDKVTAERADFFLRREAVWQRLLTLFRDHRPTDEQLAQVSTLSEVAIDQVFVAHNLDENQQAERHGLVKDYAECAALYGYVLGYWQARRVAPAAAGEATPAAQRPAAARALWGAVRALSDAGQLESHAPSAAGDSDTIRMVDGKHYHLRVVLTPAGD